MYRNYNYSSSISKFYDANEGFTKGNMDKEIYQQYKNYKPKEVQVKDKKDALLLFIQKCDFAINDLNLYLDIHENEEVVKLRNFYIKEREKAVEDYESTYGQLTNCHETKKYVWNIQPFPWEN